MKTINHTYKNTKQLYEFIKKNNFQNKKNILIQIFSGILIENEIKNIINLLNLKLPQAEIIGATTDGEINNGEVLTSSIVLSFSCFEKTQIKSIGLPHSTNNNFKTGTQIANKLIQNNTKALIIFGDGLNTNGEELLKGIQQTNPDILVAGGLAGDNATFKNTYVYTKNFFSNSGVVGVALNNQDLIINNEYSFDWLNIGKKLTITKVDKNRVYTINGMKATQAYAHYLGEEISEKLPAIGIEFPLVIDRNNNKIARAVLKKHSDGSLSFAGNFKEGEKVQFGLGNAQFILQSSDKTYNKLTNKPIESVFIYSCMARRRFMPKDIEIEIKPLQKLGTTCGFFTYGEFFHTPKNNELLNESMTILTLSEKQKTSKTTQTPKTNKKHSEHFCTVRALSNLINNTTTEIEDLNKILEEKFTQKTKQINQNELNYLQAYEKFMDNMEDAVVIINENLEIIHGNKKIKSVSGYHKQEIVGKTIDSFTDPDSLDKPLQNIGKYRKQGKKSSYKGQLILKNTKKIPVKITAMPFIKNLVIAIIEDLREIEKLKNQNKQLEQSENRYRAVVEDQTEMICRLNKDYTINFANKRLCDLINIKQNKLIGKNFFNIFNTQDSTILKQTLKSIDKKNQVKTVQHSYMSHNGTPLRLEWTFRGIFDKNKNVTEIQGVGRNISDMIFMEQKIKKDKVEYLEIYKTIVDNMSELVWIGDKNKKTVYANESYRKILGYELDEIKGKDLYELWDEKTKQKVRSYNIKFSKNKNIKGEGRLIDKNGNLLPVMVNKKPFLDGGMVMIMSDLRELKKAQQKAKELQQANKMKDEFISIASHELRTPMTSIKGYLSMMLDGDFGDLDENMKKTLNIIYESTNRQINLINDMLDISKIESNKIDLKKDLCNINDILNETYFEFHQIAKDKNIELKLQLQDSDAQLNTDKNKLKQVLFNLVGNALKFTDSGGTISIKCSYDGNNGIKFEVIDSGIGIDQNDFSKVFNKFQQVDNPLNRNQTGTGLGVPISQGIIQTMGGKLNLKSEIGKGSNFYFTLPVK